jgi:hypothetical protein
MKKVFLSLAVIAALTVVSCKQAETAPAETPVEAAPVVEEAPAVVDTTAAATTTTTTTTTEATPAPAAATPAKK